MRSIPAERVLPDAAPLVVREDAALSAPRAPSASSLGFGSPFDGDEGDVLLAEVAGVALHKRHVYDRLLEVDPQALREIEESLLLDAKLRVVAAELGVRVDDEELDFEVKREWARVERAFAKDRLGLASVDAYVRRVYGMDEAGFRAHVRRLAWRRKMRAYTIRFAQMRRGVLRLQRFVADTREAASAARRAIEGGADFGQVASQGSRGPRARRGGRMPALLLDMQHPARALADGVEVGALSRVLPQPEGEGFAFVRVLERRAARAVSFDAARGELRRALERRPISRDELLVFHAAYEGASRASGSAESAVSSDRDTR